MTEQGGRTARSPRRVLTRAAVMEALADQSRLSAIREAGLLDATPDEHFDNLTRVAARTLGASIVLISILDERRQLCKSLHGLPEPWASRREMPVTHSFCQCVVALGEPFVTGDARQDDLLRHSPAIHELGVVAYAGVPLLLEGRHVFGALAVVDTRPRQWADHELDLLRELAAAVTSAVAARLEAQRLRRVLAAIPDAVVACDRAGRIVSGPMSRPRLFGLAPEQPCATADALAQAELLDGAGRHIPPDQHPLQRALRGERLVAWSGAVPAASGAGTTPVLLHAQPIRDDGGGILGAVVQSTALEQVLDTQAEAQRELESEKDEFLTLVSHELRTPLTSLKIQTQMTLRQLARDDTLTKAQLERMERAEARIERLVNSLVEASRIQTQALALDLQTCDMQQLCAQAAEEQRQALGREIGLDLPEGPCRVRCDPDRLQQVLANLLSNAVKYSPPSGHVRLVLRRQAGEAQVFVRDQGPGIPQEALPHLFDRFYRAPNVEVQSGSHLGLGLGLFISRQIVERHGGRMWVESTVGSGSTFAFALPLQRADGGA